MGSVADPVSDPPADRETSNLRGTIMVVLLRVHCSVAVNICSVQVLTVKDTQPGRTFRWAKWGWFDLRIQRSTPLSEAS